MKRNSILSGILLLIFPYCIMAQSWQNKVSDEVFEALNQYNKQQQPTTDFFVVMRGDFDLSPTQNLMTKAEKGEYVFNILRGGAEKAQKDITTYLKHKNIPFQAFWIVNALFVKGDFELVRTLAERDDVLKIVNDAYSKLKLPTVEMPKGIVKPWGISKIMADSVWSLGYRGQGVVVGGADTGYDWLHPALKPKYRGWDTLTRTANHNYNWFDAIHADTASTGNPCGYDTQAPCDDDLHGTHTMGTMVGSWDTLLIGVAPDAKWIAARNMDRGNGSLRRYIECFEWFAAPTDLRRQNPNPRMSPHVINNSWYCSASEGCNSTNFSLLERAMNACRAAGIVVVVSAGNFGPNCETVTGPPAFFGGAFSVGATQQSDTIASFSSRGAVRIDSSGRMKPDVAAPGVGIYSSTPNGRYQNLNGTSMAGPHVAGLVALMISANPQLAGQVDTIERLIELSAKPLTSAQGCGGSSATAVPNNVYGWGRINALGAVQRGLNYRRINTQIIDKQSVIRIFPNPIKSDFSVYTEGGVSGDASIQIFDIAGRLVFNQKTHFSENSVQTFFIGYQATGIYFYKIENEGRVFNGKIVISNN